MKGVEIAKTRESLGEYKVYYVNYCPWLEFAKTFQFFQTNFHVCIKINEHVSHLYLEMIN